MRAVRGFLVAAGIVCVGYLAASTGADALLAPIRILSWRILVFLAFPYAIVAVLHTVAWQFAFARAPVPLRRLFSVRLAGEGVNLAAASVGGELVKVYLLRGSVPLIDASAAQVVDKTSITIGQVLFLAVGVAVALPSIDLPASFLRVMATLLVIQVMVVVAFAFVPYIGVCRSTIRVLERFGLRHDAMDGQRLTRFERAITASYRQRPGRAMLCVLVHLVGWVAGALEVYLVLRWLGVEGSFANALVIDAFGTGVKFMAFAVPGALGALEGSYMAAFSAMSLGSGLGLSFTLIRRLRMIVWSLLGFVVLALLRPAPTASAARDEVSSVLDRRPGRAG